MLRFYRNDGRRRPRPPRTSSSPTTGRSPGGGACAPAVGWFAGSLTARPTGRVASSDRGGDVRRRPCRLRGSPSRRSRCPAATRAVVTGDWTRPQPLRDSSTRWWTRRARPSGWIGGRLVHRGSDPLTLDLTTVAVQAYFWRGYYEPAGQASEVLAGERVEAGPGWTLDLPALTRHRRRHHHAPHGRLRDRGHGNVVPCRSSTCRRSRSPAESPTGVLPSVSWPDLVLVRRRRSLRSSELQDVPCR